MKSYFWWGWLFYSLILDLCQADTNSLQRNLHEQICDDQVSPELFCQAIGKNTTDCVDRFIAIRMAEFCDSDQSDFPDLIRRRRHASRRPRASLQDGLLAYIHQWSLNLITQITHYGCWCYFNGKIMDESYGRGSPIQGNTFDSLCKHYKHGFYSIKIDTENEGGSCDDPPTIQYETATGTISTKRLLQPERTLEDIVSESCDEVNSDVCKSRVCKVESYFSSMLFQEFLNVDFNLDLSYQHVGKHANGKFDPTVSCTSQGNGPSGGSHTDQSDVLLKEDGSVDYVLCGEYPIKRRHRQSSNFQVEINGQVTTVTKSCCGYKYMKSHRACCQNSVVYSPETHECCSDGKINLIGRCLKT